MFTTCSLEIEQFSDGATPIKYSSIAPYAFDPLKKLLPVDHHLTDSQKKRKAIQESNRKNYHYRKYLKNRYHHIEE